jgi:hypothetical protein
MYAYHTAWNQLLVTKIRMGFNQASKNEIILVKVKTQPHHVE